MNFWFETSETCEGDEVMEARWNIRDLWGWWGHGGNMKHQRPVRVMRSWRQDETSETCEGDEVMEARWNIRDLWGWWGHGGKMKHQRPVRVMRSWRQDETSETCEGDEVMEARWNIRDLWGWWGHGGKMTRKYCEVWQSTWRVSYRDQQVPRPPLYCTHQLHTDLQHHTNISATVLQLNIPAIIFIFFFCYLQLVSLAPF